jgi:hypothetical protein
MRRLLLLALALGMLLLLPAVATAKGPSGATITGPGLRHALKVDGYGEGGTDTALGMLVSEGGFFAQAFQQSPAGTTPSRPADQLGPRYDVVYTVPGSNGDSTLRQELYPYAVNGPASYMAPGQTFWQTQSAPGGWYRGSPALKRTLVKAGLPPAAPAKRARAIGTAGVAIGAGAGIAVAAIALGALYRRLPTSS